MYSDTLNSQQKEAATFSGRHLLVLAGAGTGKTRTIIARALHLIAQGTSPSRIKILSFTRKSANEIVTRINSQAGAGHAIQGLTGSTFHSWCMEMIMRHPAAFGLHGFSCIDEEDRQAAFNLIMGERLGKKSLRMREHTVKAEALAEIYSFSVNTGRNLTESIMTKLGLHGDSEQIRSQVSELREAAEEVIRGYIGYKRTRRYFDYDDMLAVVAGTLKADPALRNHIASRYDHILVDEVQDTNPLQWSLLDSFTDRCRLFCVGDDAQSIYAFRGADFRSVHSFTERFPDAEVIRLMQNYRSTQQILDLSNWLLRQSALSYDKDLKAVRGDGDRPRLFLLDDQWQEADTITDMILEDHGNGLRFRDNLVMFRGMMSVRKVEAACLSKGIPYVIFGGTSLMRSAHIRDMVSAMRVVSNPRDELAWIRYLMMWEGVGKVKASKAILRIMSEESLDGCVSVVREACPRSPMAWRTLERARDLFSDPSGAIDAIVSCMGDILKRKYEDWDMRRQDFSTLRTVAEKSDDIAAFITEYAVDPSADTTLRMQGQTECEDCVVLSTIHSAKGLEADTCYILNITPSTMPSQLARTDDEVEEERRCLYVAMTRAKNRLNLMARRYSTFGPGYIDDGAMTDGRYFLNSLPDELVEYRAMERTIDIGDDGGWDRNGRAASVFGAFDFS